MGLAARRDKSAPHSETIGEPLRFLGSSDFGTAKRPFEILLGRSNRKIFMSVAKPSPKRDEQSEEDAVLPLIEEELRVSKREVVTGRLRVRTVTETIDELVKQDLQGERWLNLGRSRPRSARKTT